MYCNYMAHDNPLFEIRDLGCEVLGVTSNTNCSKHWLVLLSGHIFFKLKFDKGKENNCWDLKD